MTRPKTDAAIVEPGFAAFVARTAPIQAFKIRAATSCGRCGQEFDTVVFLASSQRLTPNVVLEPTTTTCPRCATLADQAREG